MVANNPGSLIKPLFPVGVDGIGGVAPSILLTEIIDLKKYFFGKNTTENSTTKGIAV